MPIHDWARVKPGIFHDFHISWIAAIRDALNGGILPEDYYALAEQFAGGFGPDVLTLQRQENEDAAMPSERRHRSPGGVPALLAPPKTRLLAETEMEFYRSKQKVVAVRHVSDDEVIAVVEIVSPGNKSGRKPLQSFLDKAVALLDHGIHLLILDLHAPGRRDPQGIHAAIWEEITGEETVAPHDKPLTLAAYEADTSIRAFVEPVAVGDRLPNMPLFLKRDGCVHVPLESTYQTAVAAVPRRWRSVLEPTPASG